MLARLFDKGNSDFGQNRPNPSISTLIRPFAQWEMSLRLGGKYGTATSGEQTATPPRCCHTPITVVEVEAPSCC